MLKKRSSNIPGRRTKPTEINFAWSTRCCHVDGDFGGPAKFYREHICLPFAYCFLVFCHHYVRLLYLPRVLRYLNIVHESR